MNNGWIKINRSITNHWLWQDPVRLKWWLDLLLLANCEDSECFDDSHRFILKRGQVVASVSFLMNRWGRSKAMILPFLKQLESEYIIKREVKYRQTSIITICNYDKYQYNEGAQAYTQTDTIAYTNIRNKENINLTCINTCMSGKNPDAQKSDIDTERFLLFFNSEMDKAGASIKRARSITGNRLAMLHARCREHGKEAVCDVIRKAAKSDFLNGGGNRGFVADFTWIFRPNNFIRILEGFYDNNQTHKNHGNNQQVDQAKRRGFAVTATSSEDYKTSF